MWTEKDTTARGAAETFTKLMKARPDSWAENMNTAVKDLHDSTEQLKFLAWTADPTNACGTKDRVIEEGTVDSEISFENHPFFEIIKRVPGRLESIHVKYVPDDEKNSL